MQLIAFYVWIGVISVISASAVFVDKSRAVLKSGNRVSEQFLFFLAIMGGAVSMLITMKAIHHKTCHKRFMIGLPIVILLETVLLLKGLL